MEIVFATNNKHKLHEMRDILGDAFKIQSLADIGCHVDIPETGSTLEENAMQKAQYIWNHYHMSVFADDTGLEVEALNGEPGVHSARYADGTDHDSEANMRKLLERLEGNDNRNARFRTVIALIKGDGNGDISEVKEFEGIVTGRIATAKEGNGGFGYDPVFVPEGYDSSFAVLGEEIKNTISHRSRAVRKLVDYLRK